jgi:acetylornithine deacetylase/succinyl-diaminopimelate desuccinylase-like protein
MGWPGNSLLPRSRHSALRFGTGGSTRRSASQRCGRKRDPELKIEFTERYAAEPVLVSADNELVRTYAKEISSVLGRESHLLLSPGIDDQRFVVRDGRIDSCIFSGPGVLSMAHAPDENELLGAE